MILRSISIAVKYFSWVYCSEEESLNCDPKQIVVSPASQRLFFVLSLLNLGTKYLDNRLSPNLVENNASFLCCSHQPELTTANTDYTASRGGSRFSIYVTIKLRMQALLSCPSINCSNHIDSLLDH